MHIISRRVPYTEYPEQAAVKVWLYQGQMLSIVHQLGRIGLDHYCGYVRLNHVTTLNQKKILDVAVHGGITYGGEESVVLGFDCAHAWDDRNPQTRDLDWLQAETERMTDSILELEAKMEPYYWSEEDVVETAAIVGCREEWTAGDSLTIQQEGQEILDAGAEPTYALLLDLVTRHAQFSGYNVVEAEGE